MHQKEKDRSKNRLCKRGLESFPCKGDVSASRTFTSTFEFFRVVFSHTSCLFLARYHYLICCRWGYCLNALSRGLTRICLRRSFNRPGWDFAIDLENTYCSTPYHSWWRMRWREPFHVFRTVIETRLLANHSSRFQNARRLYKRGGRKERNFHFGAKKWSTKISSKKSQKSGLATSNYCSYSKYVSYP